MNLTTLLLLSLAVLVVATGLLGWIARLLYTWRERNPMPPPAPPMPPAHDLPARPSAGETQEEKAPPKPSPEHSLQPAAPARPLAATPGTPPAPPPDTAAPFSPAPVFYEYTANGLVPVDPYAPPDAPAAEEPAGGDTDARVAADAVEPEVKVEPDEEGFVWL